MSERIRVLLLIFIMTIVAISVAGITLFALYDAALREEGERLADAAQSQARMMEAMALFDAHTRTEDIPENAFALALEKIRNAHKRFEGFGQTGEFTLAKREGDQIVFLLKRRHGLGGYPEPVPLSLDLAEPMRRALSGQSGTIVGLDYRGEMVLAAYEPVTELGLGIVAKIDLAEIRAPFIHAGLLAGSGALVFVFLGTILCWRITTPLIRHLEESELKYRSIFEGSPNGVFLMTDAFEDCNEQACRLLACERKDILGHPLWAFSPPTQPDGRDSAETAKQHIGAALSGTPQFFHWQHRVREGVLVDTDISMKAIGVGGKKVIMVIMRDISERKHAEKALWESEKRYQTLAEIAPIGIFHTDAKGKFLYANERWGEITGFSREEALRKGLALGLHPEDRERILEGWCQAARLSYKSEYRIQRTDGMSTWVYGQVVPEKDESEEVLGYVGVITDITERKQVEEEIRQLNQELEARVMERTRELEAANREMEAFTYSVSHDLRAPLRAMDGFSEALLEDHGPKLDKEGKIYLHYLKESSREMKELIDGLLKLCRSSRGDLSRERIDLSVMTKAVVEDLRKAEPERKVTVHLAPGIEAYADPRLLKVVMENLLGNAWKYTSKKTDACIEFGSEQQEGEAVYFVRDNGAGFDMAYVDKLFLPFHRLHRTDEFSGTGIGLATVQRIVHRHGGRIWARAGVGEGALFCFTLGQERNPHE